MTIVSARNYTILTWLLPVFIIIGARDLLWSQLESAYSHIGNIGTFSDQIRRTGIHIRELPEMKSDYENLVRKKAVIASSLFGASSEAGLYELLILKAREADVSIVSVTPRPRRIDAGFAEQPLSLEATGNYNCLARFINEIEKVNRLMRVEELSMAKDRGGMLTAEIRLLVYMYVDTLPTASKTAKGGNRQENAFQERDTYLSDLQKALGVTITPPSYSYTAPSGQADPFGATSSQGVKNPNQASGAKKETCGLSLKGILWKDPPLAILESLDGKTYIVKQGESVNEVTVSSISRTDVVIATPQGDHVLHQYDQK
jgi:Tfp pilus assembly protein PilO